MPEDQYYKASRRISHEQRDQPDKENAGSFSDDDSPRIHRKHPGNIHYGAFHRQPPMRSDEFPSVERRHERGSHQSISGRDQRAHHSGKSNSEVQDVSDSSNWHSRERKRHLHGIRLEKENERRGQFASDKHRSRKEISDDEKVVEDRKKHTHRHHNHSESSLEPNFSNDRRQHRKEREASHSSRSSKQMPKSKDGRLECERWEMIEGLDDEYRGVNYHKRRRTR